MIWLLAFLAAGSFAAAIVAAVRCVDLAANLAQSNRVADVYRAMLSAYWKAEKARDPEPSATGAIPPSDYQPACNHMGWSLQMGIVPCLSPRGHEGEHANPYAEPWRDFGYGGVL